MTIKTAKSESAGPLPFSIKFGWGMGSFSSSTMYQATSVLLLHYLVEQVGMAAALAGALIGFVKLYDAVIDPLIGAASDRTVSRAGRRRPYILAGGFISAVSFAAIFLIGMIDDQATRMALAIIVLLINTTGYAVLTVPYLAMPAEMTDDPHGRTNLISFRVAGLAFGQIAGSVIAPMLISTSADAAAGHALMGFVVACIIMGAAIVSFRMTRGAPETNREAEPEMPMREKWRLALGNRPFLVLILVKLANLTGVSFFFTLMPFLFVSALDLTYGDLGTYFAIQAPLLFLSQPFWVPLSRRVGKKNVYFISVALYILSTASWVFADAGEPFSLIVLRGLAIGFASGGLLLAGQAMLPDAIGYDYKRSGLRREGIFAGVYTTVEKGGAALAAVLIGASLSAIGFIQGAGARGVQSPETIEWLKLFMLAPGVFNLLSCLILIFYHIPEVPDRPVPDAADGQSAPSRA